jgi:preprotein translocase subunit SecE
VNAAGKQRFHREVLTEPGRNLTSFRLKEAWMAKAVDADEKKVVKKDEKKEIKPAPKAPTTRRAASQDKPNFFQRTYLSLRKWFTETIGELRKVHWPTREEAFFLTRIVIVVVVIMSIILGGLDFIFSKAIELIIQ